MESFRLKHEQNKKKNIGTEKPQGKSKNDEKKIDLKAESEFYIHCAEKILNWQAKL